MRVLQYFLLVLLMDGVVGARAQSALEYLMTYGWALIVIALVVGVLVFIMAPQSDVSFSSNNRAVLVKDSSVHNNGVVGLVLQNATGGPIRVTGLYLLGDFDLLGTASYSQTGTLS